MKTTKSSDPSLASLSGLLPDLEALYTDMHAHPELSMQETRTSSLAADRLRAAGFDVTTGVSYASKVKAADPEAARRVADAVQEAGIVDENGGRRLRRQRGRPLRAERFSRSDEDEGS